MLLRLASAILLLGLVAAACGTEPTVSATTTSPAEAATTTTDVQRDEPDVAAPGSGTYEEDPEPEATTTVPPTGKDDGEPVESEDPGLSYEERDQPTAGAEPLNPTPIEPEQAPWIVSAAKMDLSQRTGAADEDIVIVSVEAVTWRDGSLGCPQPGMAYTQVLTDGARITLEYEGTGYVYHSGGNRDPFLCEKRS